MREPFHGIADHGVAALGRECCGCREHGISTASFYRFRPQYGGMDASMMARRIDLLQPQADNAGGSRLWELLQVNLPEISHRVWIVTKFLSCGVEKSMT